MGVELLPQINHLKQPLPKSSKASFIAKYSMLQELPDLIPQVHAAASADQCTVLGAIQQASTTSGFSPSSFVAQPSQLPKQRWVEWIFRWSNGIADRWSAAQRRRRREQHLLKLKLEDPFQTMSSDQKKKRKLWQLAVSRNSFSVNA